MKIHNGVANAHANITQLMDQIEKEWNDNVSSAGKLPKQYECLGIEAMEGTSASAMAMGSSHRDIKYTRHSCIDIIVSMMELHNCFSMQWIKTDYQWHTPS